MSLNFAGTVLAQNPPPWHLYGGAPQQPRIVLVIGLANSGILGRAAAHQIYFYNTVKYDYIYPLAYVQEAMGCLSARVVNDFIPVNDSNGGIVTIDNDISFQVQGGDQIVIGWYIDDISGQQYHDSGSLLELPTGDWHALLTVDSITHHPHGEAP